MYSLNQNDIHLVSGGVTESAFNFGTVLDFTLIATGVYLGSQVAYFEPLMAMTLIAGPGLPGIATYTPSTSIILAGALLGGAIGLSLSQTLQAGYQYCFLE